MTSRSLILAALLAIVCSGGAAHAQSTSRADFDRFVRYFTSGSATWQQDNADPSDDAPTAWVRRHRTAGHVSTVEVVAVFEDGRCQPITTLEYRFSAEERVISVAGRPVGRPASRGTVEALGDHRYRTAVEVELPDGTTFRMRDTTDLSDPDATTTSAERWADDAWVPLDAATWRRVDRSAWCGNDR